MGTSYPWYHNIIVVPSVRVVLAMLIASTTFLVSYPGQQSVAKAGWVETNDPNGTVHTVLQVQEEAAAVSVIWPNPQLAVAAAVDALQALPTVRYQGYELPMELITVARTDATAAASAAAAIQVEQLETIRWSDGIERAAPLVPAAIDWESMADPLRPREKVALPTSPLFLLRQGVSNGEPVAIYAFSPLYQGKNGEIQLVTNFSAAIADAKRFVPDEFPAMAEILAANVDTAFSANVSRPHAFAPTNPHAAQSATKIIVADVGVQEVSGAQLTASGLDLTKVDPAQLRLFYNGTEVALQISGQSNGRLVATSTIRFYAATIGDRINTTSVYWLVAGQAPGKRMATRSVMPATAQSRNTALEYGLWQDYTLYDSRYAGSDGDHWFHQKLIPAENNASALDLVEVNIASQLPRAEGTATYTIAVTTNVRGTHGLRVFLNGSARELVWNTAEAEQFNRDWQQPFTTTVTTNALQVALTELTAANTQSDLSVLLDKVYWEQPVQLQLQQQGAAFTGYPGRWRYNWSGLPAGYQFYDVTDAANPQLLTGAIATGFEDGPTAHHYVVAGPGTLHTPAVVAHTPVSFGTAGAQAIYITPELFISALEPILQLRRNQGYRVTVVDVQDIYDAWGYGHVSPEAIRTFLRYAHANWSPTPLAVTLVGDGTWDPQNYDDKANPNFIPPYLADVDPWLVETACDNCYVQLDGDDPVDGDGANDGVFDMEMAIGRLPVKRPGELTDLANKMVSYETSSTISLWQNRVVFVADNYIRSRTDEKYILDLAGDFAAYGDNIAALAPGTVNTTRIYYDPFPSVADPNGDEPWRIADAPAALNAVIENLSYGAGVVSYNGHSNQWQWAVTDESNPAAEQNYLLGLYDTDALSNTDRYFISMSMTCLTGQFHKPALSGTVIDERMLLNPRGGAVAVWGSTGLSVAYGHDLLQKGFFEKLWSTPSQTARLGELIEAGYAKLRGEQGCCQDTLKTFTLFGDPLTLVKVRPERVEGLYLPIIAR